MKNSLKTTCTKELEKVSKILNITKAYKSKEKFFSANRASRCAQNNRQDIIVYDTCLKKQKTRKIAKKILEK